MCPARRRWLLFSRSVTGSRIGEAYQRRIPGWPSFWPKSGGGMHHLCFEVDDIAAKLDELKGKGVRLINETAAGTAGAEDGFVHPKSTGGVLVELYQITA